MNYNNWKIIYLFLFIFSSCAWTNEGIYPRELMKNNPEPKWAEIEKEEICNKPIYEHGYGIKEFAFNLTLFFQNEEINYPEFSEIEIWVRETEGDWVQKLFYKNGDISRIAWDPFGEEMADFPFPVNNNGINLEVPLTTNHYYRCTNGRIFADIAIYPLFILVQVSGCKDKKLVVDDFDLPFVRVDLECDKNRITGR